MKSLRSGDPASVEPVPNTFSVDARAPRVTAIYDAQDLPNRLYDGSDDTLVIGDGSNVLFTRPLSVPVLTIRIPGIDIVDESTTHVAVVAGAGVVWHDLVLWSVERNLWGIENLALIPGRCGAAPIQNIGAYGAQLSDTLIGIRAWDREMRTWSDLDADALGLRYRDSLLRQRPGRYVVTSITLTLQRSGTPNLAYPGLSEALPADHMHYSPATVADTVCAVRRRKLPDPKTLGNAGSFFKNPIVEAGRWSRLREREPRLVAHPESDGQYKLSAARMVELCGWKGFRDGDAGVYQHHALVLVNHGRAKGEAIWALAKKIRASVRAAYDIELEPEPIVLE